ncbi:hypothetical protein B0H19DRAFT_1149717 [Mycena capillaripes]|nr:hypothetical protein B0H19DRAFT_1149717 [Mycena capillaripes]
MNSHKDMIHKPLFTSAITLNEFPLDTLIHIQRFMDPLDIISLRQCSKILASATAHRTVWMDALRRVCVAHEVSTLTYDPMNMSLADLEHAATTPARFISQISKEWGSEDLIPAFSTRLIQPRLPRLTTGNLGEISLMRLIPGGRYLVAATNIGRVSVWDLGYSPAAVINPYPLVSTVLQYPPSELLIQPTQDLRGFRILVWYTLGINNMIDVKVFEIYPAAKTPTFKNIATHRILSPIIRAFALTPDRFTYHCEFLITTWDFSEDTSATVHVHRHMESLTVSRTAIIGQHSEEIVVIGIPPLHPTGTPAAEAVVEPITPVPMFSHIHAVFDNFTGLYTKQADWHTAPDVPIFLDVFGRLLDGSYAYACCVVKEIPGDDPDLPPALPVLMGISRVPPEAFDAEFYGHLHFAGTHLVRTWPTNSSIMINAARVPEQRQIEFASKTAYVWDMPNGTEMFVYDLDPMSGRLVALAAGTEIRVLDYLLPNV